MKILITGGSGFIGTVLVRLLTEQGHDVIVFDKAAVDGPGSIKGDVRDLNALVAAAEGVDIIYNLAAEHRDDVRPESLYEEVNVGGGRNVVAAAEAAGVRTLVFTSSVAVYGDSDKPLSESAPHNWINEYGRTKSLAEDVHRSWAAASPNRSLVIVRPSVVFGPGNRGNVYNLLRQISAGRFVMVGSGENRKSMAYVENVAAFLVFALSAGPGVTIFNYADKPDFDMNSLVSLIRKHVGRGSGVGPRLPLWIAQTVGQLADVVAGITGKSLPISSVRVRKFAANTEVDATRAHSCGFKHPIDLREGLTTTLDHEFRTDV